MDSPCCTAWKFRPARTCSTPFGDIDGFTRVLSAVWQHVTVKASSISAAEEAAQREIALLREYRTRLIAEVVTGKLDVREAASRLPDEVEEPEPLDETDALTEGEEEPTDDRAAAPEEAAV